MRSCALSHSFFRKFSVTPISMKSHGKSSSIGAFPHGVKLNIHSGICKCLHPFFIVESFRSRNHTDIPDDMLLRSPFRPCGPRGPNTPSKHRDICLVPVIFQTFFVQLLYRIPALQSLHGRMYSLACATSVPTGTE